MPPHVLIVDDDPVTREAFAQLLVRRGYVVSEAGDGREAMLRLCADGPHRLILLDMMMPRMDGWEFLQARHADPDLAAAPVVVVTALGGVSPTTARALGADDVLQKPVAPEDLLEVVRRYCPPPREP